MTMQVKLLKTHTHNGEVFFAGSVIDVDEMSAAWLINHGVGASFGVELKNAAHASKDAADINQRKRRSKQ